MAEIVVQFISFIINMMAMFIMLILCIPTYYAGKNNLDFEETIEEIEERIEFINQKIDKWTDDKSDNERQGAIKNLKEETLKEQIDNLEPRNEEEETVFENLESKDDLSLDEAEEVIKDFDERAYEYKKENR